MNENSTPLDDRLRQANPVPAGPTAPVALDERARTDLDRILGGHQGTTHLSGGRRHRRPSRLTAARVAAVLLIGLLGTAAVVLKGGGGDPATAATPPPLHYEKPATDVDATVLLHEIAARAEQRPDRTGKGRYSYTERKGWYLSTTVDGEQVTSEVVPQFRRAWTASDGSGRLVDEWTFADGDTKYSDRTEGPGKLAVPRPSGSLSTDPAQLAAQLSVGHPVSNGPAERLVAITDLHQHTPVPPRLEAAVLRYLADTPGLVVSGDVTDRAGRRGVAFSLESAYSGLPTRYTLIVDPDTGDLLGREDMLTVTAGKLRVPVPSVISYTVFLDARFTDSLQ
jgi:hypothetical protein